MNHLELTYHHYSSLDQIPLSDKELIEQARQAALNSHSPYSHFAVGAAARLASGVIIRGANIESEVFPAGICAERALLFHTASNYPTDPIAEFAVTSLAESGEECYPCGPCRQTLLDTERRQAQPIKIIMAGSESATVVDSASTLLPFAFKL